MNITEYSKIPTDKQVPQNTQKGAIALQGLVVQDLNPDAGEVTYVGCIRDSQVSGKTDSEDPATSEHF